MKQLVTATALTTLLLIGCSQESSDPTLSDPSSNADISQKVTQKVESIKEEVKEVVDPSSLPSRRTGSVQIFPKNDGIAVIGYTMSQPDGIRTVEVLINGEPAGIAAYKLEEQLPERFDDFYDPNKPNVGFEYQIDTSKLKSGKHSVTIRATTVNGNSFSFGSNKTFNVE